ncbi:hypothetical protein PQX77_002016, partial [Marasmius sp. AFHP31]
VEGLEFYRRVKKDINDPNDANWISNDPCPVCLTKGFDIAKACLLTCTDKKKLYCEECVLEWRQRRCDAMGRVPCPICKREAYFVSTKWVFVNNTQAREKALQDSRKRHQRDKLARKKARNALQRADDGDKQADAE